MLLIVGCATDNYSSRSTIDADREAVMKIMDRLPKALREGDLETYLTLYTVYSTLRVIPVS
jgi:hypothetical protein